MTTQRRWPGNFALMIAHCAGMVDLVALPVWVGTLIAAYKFDPQQAGLLPTLFLVGAVISSLFFAPRFNRISPRVAAPLGFAIAAVAFAVASVRPEFPVLAVCHLVAGLSAGCALSFAHGTIGRSANPHRLFALAGLALGVFAIVFLGATPNLVAALGGEALFRVFAVVMAVATVVTLALFPNRSTSVDVATPATAHRFDRAIWACMLGVGTMALVQSMVFSFLQSIGTDRGFGLAAVTGVLIALGFVNLLPAPLAAILEKRLRAERVILVGPVVQAALALLITLSSTFIPYAAAGVFFAAVMIFTHTFAFGLLSRLEGTGRAVAATPAMLMTGAAVGPILAGTLVKFYGYPAIGIAAVVFGLVAIAFFSQAGAGRQAAMQPAE
jgi:predicted MFS family arabinose efflux permease